eukprot:TRINITY_DN94436_c0_g1_i1.p1 TRINITY_DN94436_c0_g1~~TRINITY_DN94436_c0_g1_i1.p1  ORF type:complete len:130 (-),score=17.01 TRINITY_DN94436_c0_g1_i1:425-769(-)
MAPSMRYFLLTLTALLLPFESYQMFAVAHQSPRAQRPEIQQEPPLPPAAFACAASARGQSTQPCTLYGEGWKNWQQHQETIGNGSMSFPHPLDRFYSVLGIPLGVPPMVGMAAD